jgi:hypothetical protein
MCRPPERQPRFTPFTLALHPAALNPLYVCSIKIPLYIHPTFMTKQQALDLYFLDARHKLVEIAAFLDRVERASGKDDFRLKAFRTALAKLDGKRKNRVKAVLLAFSDPTTEPIFVATAKGATGAWQKPANGLAPPKSKAAG